MERPRPPVSRWKFGMDVSAFRFAIETLEKDRGRWSVLCLMADDLEAARMAWTLVEMLPGDGVRIALIDPHLADSRNASCGSI